MKKVVLSILGGLILFFIGFFLIGVYLTNSFVDEQIEKLAAQAEEHQIQKFSQTKIDTLPQPVRNYFNFAIADSLIYPRFVRMKQEGKFKTNVGADYKKLTAEQYSITKEPGFIWSGDIYLASFLWINGIDTYLKERGDLLIKFMSGITISKESGKEIAQAQVVRWLLEAAWYPTALLPSKNLIWRSIDSTSAKLSYTHQEIKIDAEFHFNSDGSINKVTTQRYMTTTAGPQLTDYTGYFSDYKNVNGMMIPHHGEVEWKLADQDFKYYVFDINEIEFDNFAAYE